MKISIKICFSILNKNIATIQLHTTFLHRNSDRVQCSPANKHNHRWYNFINSNDLCDFCRRNIAAGQSVPVLKARRDGRRQHQPRANCESHAATCVLCRDMSDMRDTLFSSIYGGGPIESSQPMWAENGTSFPRSAAPAATAYIGQCRGSGSAWWVDWSRSANDTSSPRWSRWSHELNDAERASETRTASRPGHRDAERWDSRKRRSSAPSWPL